MQRFKVVRPFVLTGTFVLATVLSQWSSSSSKAQAQPPDSIYPDMQQLDQSHKDIQVLPHDFYLPWEIDESLISGSPLTGGDEFEIRGQIGSRVRFSIRGKHGDEVVILLPSGQELRLAFEDLLWLPPDFPLQVVNVTFLLDGSVIVEIVVFNALEEFNGAIVSLLRHGVVLDSDPVHLRRRRPVPDWESRDRLPIDRQIPSAY